MDTNAYIIISLAALPAAFALIITFFPLPVSRVVEGLFDTIECALAARARRRAEMHGEESPRTARPRLVAAPARTRLSALSLVARDDRAAA